MADNSGTVDTYCIFLHNRQWKIYVFPPVRINGLNSGGHPWEQHHSLQ
jgi:hypothetical protein